MSNITEELKKKFGGKGQTIAEVVKTMESGDLPEVTAEDNGDVLTVVDGAWDKASPSGGSDLPEVTAEDNGDVLTVVDGAWDKASPSGGGGVFLITLTSDPDSPVVTFDKTWKEVHDALLGGKQCIVFWDQSYDDNVSISWSTVLQVDNYYGEYRVTFAYNGDSTFSTASENGYPEYNYG